MNDILEIKNLTPDVRVEVLTPDFKGNISSIKTANFEEWAFCSSLWRSASTAPFFSNTTEQTEVAVSRSNIVMLRLEGWGI